MSEWLGHWSERKTGQSVSSPPFAIKQILLSPVPPHNFTLIITPLFLSSPFLFFMQNFFELQEKLVLLLL